MGIAENIERLREEIALECERAGRDIYEITLVGASKYTDSAGIEEAHAAGLRDFGENRVQEALVKIEASPDDIIWHMIGHLQRNKVTSVVGNFEFIHSVDSIRLAEKIDQVAKDKGLIQKIMLEINIGGEESKFGVETGEADPLISSVVTLENVRLTGFMTMAPFVEDDAIIRGVFSGLRRLRDRIAEKYGVAIPFLSMGMTHDWRIAIQEGATHLRIGSAIFRD